MPRASLEKRPHEVAAMFDEVAARYDRTNDVLSLGLDRRWRRAAATAVVRPGDEVLDAACGTGDLAVACAREGASVVASDLSPGMVERGRARSEREGYDIEWVEADVEALPFEDGRFDCVGSVFGAMIAPRPRIVAEELFRVVRPGGTVGMATWPDRGFQGDFFQVLEKHGPAVPDGVPSPRAWGEEDVVRERLDGLAASVSVDSRVLPWRFESFPAMADFFRRSTPRGLDELPQEQLAALVADLQAVVERHNGAGDGSIEIDAEYSLVVARKRG
jgi:ubiquinone/menaquinone biosynthesis C-methylase UbiE